MVSRLRNPLHGLTGALLFDGARFCQLLEGSSGEVQALMRNIAVDPRHVQVDVVWTGISAGPRAMMIWASGYCDGDALDSLDDPEGLRGAHALTRFLSVVQRADME